MRGSLIYWPALLLLLMAGLVILRLFARTSYRVHGNLSPAVSLIQTLFFFVYGGFPMLYLPKDWPAVRINPWLHGIGLALLLGGLAFLLIGIARLGLGRSLGRGRQALEKSGLYRRSRNPQAVACGGYVVGFAILWPSGIAAGWALLYPVLIHTMVLTEEAHLHHLYGAKYAVYCRQVPRYLGIWERLLDRRNNLQR